MTIRTAEVPLHGSVSRYKKAGAGRGAAGEVGEQFCEFQAGSSFDLPNMAVLARARAGGAATPDTDKEHDYR